MLIRTNRRLLLCLLQHGSTRYIEKNVSLLELCRVGRVPRLLFISLCVYIRVCPGTMDLYINVVAIHCGAEISSNLLSFTQYPSFEGFGELPRF